MTGWNIWGFDLTYIYWRIVNCGAYEALHMSRLRNYECKEVVRELSSAAMGKNELKRLPMPGRFIFDLMQNVKIEQKYESYSLNAVSTLLLRRPETRHAPF